MIPNSRSLLIKIQDLLDGKIDPQIAETVADEYNQICEQINARIHQFTHLIHEGNYYAALDIAQLEPTLTTQIERIRFPRETEWRSFLEKLGYPVFEGFDDSELKRVKEVCADPSITQPPGYRAYRKAILLKDKTGAIGHLRQLHKDFPKDQNAKKELIRLEREAFESIEKELTTLLRLDKKTEAVEKVSETIQQQWLIAFESETWDAAFKLYEKNEHRKYHDKVLQAISQSKVIQRVGNWEDASSTISLLREAKSHAVYAELTAVQQNELNAVIGWYRQCELANNEQLRNQEAFDAFKTQLEPSLLEEKLAFQRKKEIRRIQGELQSQWSQFEAILPDSCRKSQRDYQQALSTIESYLERQPRGRGKLKWLWLVLAPVFLLIAMLFYWINHRESVLGEAVALAYEASDIPGTRNALNVWDEFTRDFYSKHNPLRHYRSHRKIQEVRGWLDEMDIRQEKIGQLLDRIEAKLSSDPGRGELRRVQMNLSIVHDLLAKMPETGDSSLATRYQFLEGETEEQKKVHIEDMRAELVSGLEHIEQLFRTHFPENKSDFKGVYSEIAELKNAIKTVESQLRQSFDESSVADLKVQLDDFRDALDQYEDASIELDQFENRLRQSIALSEYLDYLHHLSKLPFKNHPLVKQAILLDGKRASFENLAQQLLLPDNALGWKQFLQNIDKPLVAEGTLAKELEEWKILSGQQALKNVYRYRLHRYKDGHPDAKYQFLFCHNEVKRTSETAQTSGRAVFTAKVFDERYIGRGLPFTEKTFICETDASGRPLNGDYLELDRLTPESGYYRQLAELCGWNSASNSIEEPILEVIDTIKENAFISPIFKAWLTQQLFNIMMVRAYDWGLNFCPSAQLDYRDMIQIKGTLFPYDWLRPSTQNRILQPLAQYYENLDANSYYKQAQASRDLFKQVARQRIRYGGYANENGLFMLLNSTPIDRKLFGLRVDGSIDLLRRPANGEEPPTNFQAEPFTPILFFNDPPDVILDRVTRNTGVDVNSEAFRPYLPSIFL